MNEQPAAPTVAKIEPGTKVSVTYHPPKGDSKVLEWGGHTFFDGKSTELIYNGATASMIDKMRGHPHFDLAGHGISQSAPKQPTSADDDSEDEESDGDKAGDKSHAHKAKR